MKFKKILIIIIPLILCLFWILGLIYLPTSNSKSDKFIMITPRTSTRKIANVLQEYGLIKNKTIFYIIAKLKGKNLQAGEYKLNPQMNMLEILNKIINGEVYAHRITIPEGFNIYQIANLLEKKELTNGEKFINLCKKEKLEGFLFPDTYYIPKGKSEKEITNLFFRRFKEIVPENIEERAKKNGLNLKQLITLASLIEKEAKKENERKRIAGVLLNKLRKGQRLQCDATVQYAQGFHKNRLFYSDLKIDSPYNTYLHSGLPPHPICNPGLSSILAALSPEKHDYFFYVAKKDGGHIFTKTYQEHLQAIKKIRGGIP